MLAHLGAMLPFLEGNVGHLGAMLVHLGAMLAQLGATLAHVGPSWGYVATSWGHVGPSGGLCWPILKPRLAHVEPSRATRAEKLEKMGRAQNTVKRGGFWRPGVSAAGGAAPLSYGEERNAYGNATARGPLAEFKRLRATAGQGPNYGGRGGGRGCSGSCRDQDWLLWLLLLLWWWMLVVLGSRLL